MRQFHTKEGEERQSGERKRESDENEVGGRKRGDLSRQIEQEGYGRTKRGDGRRRNVRTVE